MPTTQLGYDVADPRSFDTGADRQQGGTTPLGVAGGLVQGLTSPISNRMDPELEAQIRAKYIQLYNEISVEEERSRRETVETWGSVSASILSAEANILAAVAEGAKASAMNNQAKADAMRLMEDMTKAASEMKYYEPDRQTFERFASELQLMEAAIQSKMSSADYGTGVSPMDDLDTAYAKWENVLNKTDVRALKQVTTIVTHANELSGDPQLKADTVRMEYFTLEAEIRQGFAMMAAKDGISLSEAEGERLTQQYMARHVAPQVWGDPERGLPGVVTDEERTMADQRRAQAVSDYEGYLARLDAMSAGLPREYVDEARLALRQAQSIVAGGPEVFADITSRMPSPEGTRKTKAMIEHELAKLGADPPDPLVAAKREIVQVPGFDVWMQAMGFTNVTRAMLYAGNHPYEFKEAVKSYVMAKQGSLPESVTTPGGMREHLREKGRQDGMGFFMTPLGRAVSTFTGRRRFGGDLSDKLQEVRMRLEEHEPKTELGAGLKERFGDILGRPDKLPERSFRPEDEDDLTVDEIEEDVAWRTRLDELKKEPGGEELVQPGETTLPAGFRDVQGVGGYVYRQHSDGSVQLVGNPSGTATADRPISVSSPTALAAIQTEIGVYPATQVETAPGGPGDGPITPLDEDPHIPVVRVNPPPGKEGKSYTIVKLNAAAGGWTLKVFDDDFQIQVMDAPGFDDEVGKAYGIGTHAHQALMRDVQHSSEAGVGVTPKVDRSEEPAAEPKPEPTAAAKKPEPKKRGPVVDPNKAIAAGFPRDDSAYMDVPGADKRSQTYYPEKKTTTG